MDAECLYVRGVCDHAECAAWPGDPDDFIARPKPTVEDECAAHEHAYYGDDAGKGRCYCGLREHPLGGPSRVSDLLADLEASMSAVRAAKAAQEEGETT